VIAGPQAQETERLRAKIVEEELVPWVKVLGYVSRPELRALYRLASAFVFPSLCEGFGNPLLEAMASRLPVAASGVSSLPEVGGEAAVYFDPKSPEDMSDKIMRLLRDTELRQELIAKGEKRVLDFDWERTASETRDFYQAILGQ
jgi:glycosyltransferase involved in cell wall biosynthesis